MSCIQFFVCGILSSFCMIFFEKVNINEVLLARIPILYAGVLFASVNLLGLSSYGISVMESVIMGIPGIIMQLLFIPVTTKLIKEGMKLEND